MSWADCESAEWPIFPCCRTCAAAGSWMITRARACRPTACCSRCFVFGPAGASTRPPRSCPPCMLHDVKTVPIHPMYINGAWREGGDGDLAEDVNPATGETFARIAQASARDVDDAIAAAYQSRLAWQKML